MGAHAANLPCEVATTYGLHPRSATRLEGGYSNESWRVDCAEGPFVVRRYGRLHLTRRALVFEHAIMEHAAQRLREVRAPLRDPEGSTLLERDGFLAVLPFIPGVTGARDPAARVAGARLLARFHRAMSDVHIAGGLRSTRSLGILGRLRERFVGLAADRTLAGKLEWDALIAATTAAVARLAPLARQLPHTIVHGDVQPENFVRDREESVGLIDFDFAHETERAYDVATGIDEFGRAGDDAPLDLAAAAEFARAYGDELALAAAERAALADLMIRRNATLVWYIVTRHGERVPGDVGNAARYLARVREIERLRAELQHVA